MVTPSILDSLIPLHRLEGHRLGPIRKATFLTADLRIYPTPNRKSKGTEKPQILLPNNNIIKCD